MVLTRTLSAQNTQQPTQADVSLKAKVQALASRPNAGGRNVSSPCVLQASAGNVRSPSGSSCAKIGSSRRKGSSGNSSGSSRRSLLGSSDFGDSSGEEDNGGHHNERNSHRRLGGCFHSSQTATRPDDSNKENVAPFRSASSDVLQQEARNAQEEQAVQHITRTRRASLMERPSFSLHRRLSRGSASSEYSVTSGKCQLEHRATPRPDRLRCQIAILSEIAYTRVTRHFTRWLGVAIWFLTLCFVPFSLSSAHHPT